MPLTSNNKLHAPHSTSVHVVEVPVGGMGSLFDVAAGLSQYGGDAKPNNAKLQAMYPQSALGILDETFETIYGARQYRSANPHLPLVRSTSMVQLKPTRLGESKSSEALDARLHRLASFKSSATAPERRVAPAIAVAGLIVPPPPSAPPPPDNVHKQNNRDRDPDATAKAVLREVTSEVDQLMATSTSSAEEDESLLRMISDKYVHARLSKLSGTPFVLLVRKKVAQKLEQLEQHVRSRRESNQPATWENLESENNSSSKTENSSPMSFGAIPTAKSLQLLSATQHEVLQNLLRLPDKQLLKLPKAQLELVQFAKRYDKLVKATPDQLRHLPIEHQQLVRSMQRQQKQLRTDERR
ncbi:hypothetical protein PHYPSEUDO_006666 [Phytophthora pseudosyringae]|uniref:Uncharacterized protein n=1 Tax=Phytophthora pseudosyringae TaxID=221518 RepID=A0A8T1VIV1_9STRA|nr:hypothetical protein PHYPSEUDO_006666 [Phytophthora pseudosyringae]